MRLIKNCPKLNKSDSLVIEMKFFQSVGSYDPYNDNNNNMDYKSVTISKLLFVFFSDISQLKYEEDKFIYPDDVNNNFSNFLNIIVTATNEVKMIRTTTTTSDASDATPPTPAETTVETVPPTTSTNTTQNTSKLFPVKLSTINYRKTALTYILYSSLFGNTVCYSLGMINQKKVVKSIPLMKLLSIMNNYKVYIVFSIYTRLIQ